MAEKILVPDISGAENVDVIEVIVSAGDKVAVDDPLITLEGDKATMDVPSPKAGVIESVDVKVGDKVSEGSLILTLKVEGGDEKAEEKSTEKEAEAESKEKETEEKSPKAEKASEQKTTEEKETPKKEEAPKEEAKEQVAKEETSTSVQHGFR